MDEKILQDLEGLPDEVLKGLSFSVPWQYEPESSGYQDPDGFRESRVEDSNWTRENIRAECWRKFNNNPQINTAIRGIQGRLSGLGFGCSSGTWEVQEVIEEIWFDYRNRLHNFMPRYIARHHLEGELFLLFTIHPDGFIEIDFIDPAYVAGGKDDVGIIYHSSKQTLPLFYNIKGEKDAITGFSMQIPSVYIAHNPSLVNNARKNDDFKSSKQTFAKSRRKMYQGLGGYYRFILGWDRGLIVRRATSYLKTTLEWINQYELLKKYEIEHKRSAGSYLWIFTIEDPTTFKLWLALSDEDRRKTGIMAKKTPGGTLVLPPGMTVEAKNPSLPTLNEQDTDIIRMVSSGLNEEEGVMQGRSSTPYASIKASRGPMTDRIGDEMAWFRNYLLYDFWDTIFLLKNKTGFFKEFIEVDKCVGFTVTEKKNPDTEEVEYKHKPIFKKVKVKPNTLVDVSFPTSEMIDFENRAKGLLGTKHGPISDTLGIPNSEVAARMGFTSYAKSRFDKETEKKAYPKLIYSLDAESLQERKEAEPPKKNNKNNSDDGE